MKFNTLYNSISPEPIEESKFSSLLAGVGLSLSTLLANDLYAKPQSKTVTNDNKVDKNVIKDTKVLDYIKFLTRVLFAEVGGSGKNIKVSEDEQKLVASVIKNRINHPAFINLKTGKVPKSAIEVVTQPYQFSSINDNSNSLWKKSTNINNLNKQEADSWNNLLEYAVKLQNNVFVPINPTIVAYHDKSIKKPSNWENNKYWKYIKEVETPNFVFYKISKRK